MPQRLLSAGAALIALFFLALLPARAQQLREYPEHRFGPRCAFDSVQDAAWRRNPAGRQEYRAWLQQVAETSAHDPASLLRAAPDVTVPVVMHIIYSSTASNISDAQVNDALRIVNLDFSKTNPDTTDVIALFRPLIANVGFRFRLAKIDPNGNCTSGITHTYSTLSNIGDDQVKQLINWDVSRYLNVWICQNANGAGGYSILPCQGGQSDGIVIRNSQFGSVGTSCSANLCHRSLSHEIGHYFGLPHTWGGNNTPGLASNCGLDDGIADTPNTSGYVSSGGNGSCNTAYAPCRDASNRSIIANVQNFMDYADCEKMFTLGQRAVMRASLLLSCRSTLVSGANLVATGTNDGYVASPCAPVIVLQPSSSSVCESSTVTFEAISYTTDLTAPGTTFSWQFPGGTPATSTSATPAVTYLTQGTYNVTLTVRLPSGSSFTSTANGLVQVSGSTAGLLPPVNESFENPAFPNNFPAPDLRNWTTGSTAGTSGWQRIAAGTGGLVPADGSACEVVPSPSLPLGTVVTLTSPNLNLSSFSASNPPELAFDRAYARRSGVGTELLKVQVSTDCGVTWNTERSYFPAPLSTMGSQLLTSFVPTALAQWQTTTIPIDPMYLGPRFQLRFEFTTQGGNPLYLDHVRLMLPTATRAADFASAGLHLFPNPYTAETAVALSLDRATLVETSLSDVLGREVLALPAQRLGHGVHTLPLATPGLRPGLYVVRVRLDGQLHTAKLVVR